LIREIYIYTNNDFDNKFDKDQDYNIWNWELHSSDFNYLCSIFSLKNLFLLGNLFIYGISIK